MLSLSIVACHNDTGAGATWGQSEKDSTVHEDKHVDSWHIAVWDGAKLVLKTTSKT